MNMFGVPKFTVNTLQSILSEFSTWNTQCFCHILLCGPLNSLTLDALEQGLDGAFEYLFLFPCTCPTMCSKFDKNNDIVWRWWRSSLHLFLGTTSLHIFLSMSYMVSKLWVCPDMCSFKVTSLTNRKSRFIFAQGIIDLWIHNSNHNYYCIKVELNVA
jgi:hypothetical protein